jgi:hypothetical protein
MDAISDLVEMLLGHEQCLELAGHNKPPVPFRV